MRIRNRDYVAIGNLTKLRIARAILKRLYPLDTRDQHDQDALVKILERAIERYERKID